MDLRTVLSGISDQMALDFTKVTAQIGHPYLRGQAREEVVGNFLRGYLPPRFGVGTGIVVSSKGSNSSRQIDIVVYDKDHCPLFYNQKGMQVFPVEMVLATIEVKSRLTKNEIKKAYINTASITSLERGAYHNYSMRAMPKIDGQYEQIPMLSVIFGFDGIGADSALEHVCHYDNEQNEVPGFFVNLTKGYVIGNASQKGSLSSIKTEETVRAQLITPNETLLVFYLGIFDWVVRANSLQLDVRKYLRGNLGVWGKQGVRTIR